MAAHGRVDIHCHIATPEYQQQLVEQNARAGGWGDWRNTFYSKMTSSALLEAMDEGGVATSMLSIVSIPAAIENDLAAHRRFCRENNDFVAGLISDHPGRFGLFASLPMPDVDSALEELAYAFDELHADGVRLETCYEDRWVADESFAPLYEELNRRKAVIYTHPKAPACCKGILPDVSVTDAIIELGTDTARAILQVCFGGAAKRYPNVTFIFSHAGGTMPALVERFTDLAKTPRFAPEFPDGFAAYAREFYYDTAQTANRAAMSALAAVVPISQIVFGTDFPYRTSANNAAGLANCGVYSPEDLEAIDWVNAHRLIPRLAQP